MTRRRNNICDDEEMPGPSQSQRQCFRVTRRSNKDSSPASQSQNNQTEDDDIPSQSQCTQTKSRSQKKISDDECNRLVGRVVKYILVSDRSRYPILRQNIQKKILNGTNHYRTVMDEAIKTLKRVFGYRLVQFDNVKYILVNEVNNPHLSFPSEKTSMLLLFLVLAHIFMSDDVCSEDSIWNLLRKLGIVNGDDFMHEHFGNVHDLISVKFVKQHYLIRLKVDGSEPEKFHYQWGERAEYELNKYDVLQFVSRVFRNRPMQSWPNQFRIAEQSKPMIV